MSRLHSRSICLLRQTNRASCSSAPVSLSVQPPGHLIVEWSNFVFFKSRLKGRSRDRKSTHPVSSVLGPNINLRLNISSAFSSREQIEPGCAASVRVIRRRQQLWALFERLEIGDKIFYN